ncbi:GNAT family N-acetyltransferase [Paenibacillus sp. MBLB4367]|uniref:GNAT family N-acetyltransferase n=1 Tax=Paenibacillus sp. MBLB4367 TaxID=3384767 RepID=UPI003907F505
MIRLQEVTCSDWYACAKLEVMEEQRGVSPAPVVYWLAESRLEKHLVPLAVYLQASLIGFAVYSAKPDEQGRYWIMGLMIGRRHQRRGYGKAALAELVSLLSETYGARAIAIGHCENNTAAAKLYEAAGFREVSAEDGEIVRCLEVPVTSA